MLHSYGIERPFTEESVLNSVIFHVLNLQRVITSELISSIFKIIVEITQLLSSSSLLRSSSSCLVRSWYDPVVALKFDDTTSLAPETHPKHIPNAHLFLNNQAVRFRCGIFRPSCWWNCSMLLIAILAWLLTSSLLNIHEFCMYKHTQYGQMMHSSLPSTSRNPPQIYSNQNDHQILVGFSQILSLREVLYVQIQASDT